METQALPIALLIEGPHYLASLAAEVHRTYFFKYPILHVRWGQQIQRKSRRSIRLGSYNHITNEIRIHPSLNSHHIPAFFIQSIIHHEYLHHMLGAPHNRKFKSHERRYRYHREAQEWIRRNLFLLLGRRRSELEPRRGVVVAVPPVPAVGQMALF